MKRSLNQKLINLIEYYNLNNSNLLLNNVPIKRTANHKISTFTGSKVEKLQKLKKSIQSIKNCELKKNATNIVFGDGSIDSKIMIIGEGPGANEDIEGNTATTTGVQSPELSENDIKKLEDDVTKLFRKKNNHFNNST